MNIEINEGQMKSLVSEAILRTLDEKARDGIIKEAIEYLTTTPRNAYNNRTPLQESFNNALSCEATRIIRELLTQDAEFVKLVQKSIRAAVEKVMTGDGFVELLARKISSAFGND